MGQRIKKIIALFCCALLPVLCLTGCGDKNTLYVVDAGQEITKQQLENYNITMVVNTPTASGTVVYSKLGTTIDASNTKDGYVMVKHEGSTKRLKAKVICGEQSYSYDLNNQGIYEVYPLQMGNGEYEIKVYENIQDTTYSVLFSATISVNLTDENRVFLYPSQYVWYTGGERAIALSELLCKDLTTDEQKVSVLYSYVTSQIEYDYEKAKTVQSGYLPNIEETLTTKKGICFDYTALLAALLRAQNIPTRLAIGTIPKPADYLHAWNQVYLDGKWIWLDPTYGEDNQLVQKDYTILRKY